MRNEKPDLRAHLILTLQLHRIPQWLGMGHRGAGGSGILFFSGLEISLMSSVHG